MSSLRDTAEQKVGTITNTDHSSTMSTARHLSTALILTMLATAKRADASVR